MATKSEKANSSGKGKPRTRRKSVSKPTATQKKAASPTKKRTAAADGSKKKTASQAAAGNTASASRRGRGRPTVLSDELVEEICDRLAGGESLIGICRSRHMPNRSTIRRWLVKGSDEVGGPAISEFCAKYARAREDQADALADEILEVARIVTEKNANAKRVLIDALKWRAGKLKPRVYGNRVDHSHGGKDGGPIPIASASVNIDNRDAAEAARRYREFIDAVG